MKLKKLSELAKEHGITKQGATKRKKRGYYIPFTISYCSREITRYTTKEELEEFIINKD